MHPARHNAPTPRGRSARASWWSAPAACLTTLLALPASGAGIDIPNDPLTTGSRVAPNILFILDDSGSMAYETMPDDPPRTTTPDVSNNAYTRNSLAYNPAKTYLPWRQADGTRMTGGTNFNAVYGSFNLVGGSTIDAASATSCRRYNANTNATVDEPSSGGTQVCGGIQTFYVPKNVLLTDANYLGDGRNYYRYQISGSDVVRSEYGEPQSSSGSAPGFPITGLAQSSGDWRRYQVTVPANTRTLVIRTSGGGIFDNADLYVRRAAAPTQSAYDCRSNNLFSGEECVISSPAAGDTYEIGVYGGPLFGYSNVTLDVQITTNNRCGTGNSSLDWINCQSATPTGRTIAAEQANYATWASYHRTRMKAAKAGASEAFGELDSRVRVGFRTIWNRNNFDIPVGDGNDGRFVDRPASQDTLSTSSRSTWYSRLYNVIGSGGTPLHGALDSAGRYFSQTDAAGPYGPQEGSGQFSCRQNFAILTTDGFWTDTRTRYGTKVGNQDGSAGETIVGPNNRSYRYSPSAPYMDSYSDTLADVAMRYWKSDLRPDLTNNVPSNSANPAFWQHMVTFGISVGLNGNKPWSSVAEVPANATWEDPTDREDADRIDDLLHAAVNSRGAFVAASNPEEFGAGLQSALAVILQRTSSSSNVATNSVSLGTGTQVFNASYVSGIWTGQVTARPINSSGVAGSVTWTSSLPDWNQRKIFTRSSSGGAGFPTAAQIGLLARSGGVTNFEVSGADNANYIKGERRLEVNSGSGGRLRNRTGVLGDIVGSSPAYVSDTNTLYVGANDGMMHAFDATSGRELFAYVPGIANISGMGRLSRPDYPHLYFVDGPVVVSPRTLTPGQNRLVGTLGRGGKGVYSLDVSNPATFAAGDVSWERNSGNLMGHVLGRPILAAVNNATTTGTRAVVLGNGVNSTSNRAALIVLNLATGAVIREIDTGIGSEDVPNGLSAPTGVYAADGLTLDYVYAGDLRGNVWKFDLTSSNSSNWTASRIFTAADANATAQPISGAVAVATHPTTRQRWVFFGTGRYLTVEDADPSYATPQSMYAVIDDATTPRGRASLQPRVIAVTGQELDGYPVRAFEQAAALPADKKGWYIDLPGAGERIVQDAQIVGNFLITASMLPTGSACEADGTGFINALDAFTGTSARGSYFDIDGDGSTDDSVIGSNRLPVGSINTGIGMPTLPNLLRGRIVIGGSDGSDPRSVGSLHARWDRMSWREVRGD